MRRILIFIYFSILVSQLASPPWARGEGARRALLVGIGHYRACNAGKPVPRGFSRQIDDLEGPTHDVAAMERLLRRYGFTEIIILPECSATRDNIFRAYRDILVPKKRNAGDLGVFYFSGHGSQLRNPHPQARRAEGDGMDETIVPVDAPIGGRDIRDKEWAGLFRESLEHGLNLTAVFDSCYSGSLARAADAPKARFAEPDRRPQPGLAPPKGRLVYEDGALIFSAAMADQTAREQKDSHGITHGLFTQSLLQVLHSAPDAAAGHVVLRTRELLRTLPTVQVPVLQANRARLGQALFGTRPGQGARAVVAIRSIGTGGEVELDGGLAVGLRPGAELLKVTDAQREVRLRVERSDELARATARVISGRADTLRVNDAFAVARWALPQEAHLRVYLGHAPELARQLKVGEGTSGSALAVVSTAAEADYVLRRRKGSQSVEYAWMMTAGGGRSQLPAATRWVQGRDLEIAADELTALAWQLGKIRAWLRLVPPTSGDEFPYDVVLRNEQTGEYKGLPGAPDQVERVDRIREGERYQVVLRRRLASAGPAERRYVYLLALNQKGRLRLLYPPRGGSAGNEENRLPRDDENERQAPETIRLHGGRAIFQVNCGSRKGPREDWICGMETYLLLSTSEPLLRPDLLSLEGVARDSAPPQLDALGILLYRLSAAARDPGPPSPPPTSWSISRIIVESSR